MGKYADRVTHSARGETFNPLIWPAIIATAVYGVGFTAFFWLGTVGHSSLFVALSTIHSALPILWGLAAVTTVVIGFTFLLYNIPKAGKTSGWLGFMVWLFACFGWCLTGGIFVALAVGVPNMWFWIWQYFELAKFRREDLADLAYMKFYDTGGYDDKEHPTEAKRDREDNRGVDQQSHGSYDNPDVGDDPSRPVDSQ